MDNIYTTADGGGLDPNGWYPGKKHGFLKNLGRVASMGIYSPDNRISSAINIDRLKTRGQNEEELNMRRALHALALDSLKDFYTKAHPELTPDQVTQRAAQAYASKFLADTSENEARGANAEVDKEKAKGLLPGAAGTATAAQNAARANAEATTARNRNVEAYERGRAPYEMDAGAKEILAGIEGSRTKQAEADAAGVEQDNRKAHALAVKTFNTPYETAHFDKISLDENTRRLQEQRADTDWNRIQTERARPIVADTMIHDAERKAAETVANKLEAEATAKAMANPTTADAVVAGRINKGSLTVPYGATVHPIIPVDPTNALQGETRHPDVIEYDQKINPVNGQMIPVVRRKVYGNQSSTNAPSTADFQGLGGGRAPIPVDPNVLKQLFPTQ